MICTLYPSPNAPLYFSSADIKFANHGKIETEESSGLKHYFAAIHPNNFSPSIVVIAENGNVTLESQDWAASLGLKVPV